MNPYPYIENADAIAPLPNGPVRLRYSPDEIRLEYIVRRRWWQLWRPKRYPRILGSEPFQIQGGDIVRLTQNGSCYSVTVNDNIVLQYGRPE